MCKWILPNELYVNEDGNLVQILNDDDCENPRHDDDGLFSHFYTWNDYASPDTVVCYDYYGQRHEEAPTLWDIMDELVDRDEFEAYAYAKHLKNNEYAWMADLADGYDDGCFGKVVRWLNEHGHVALPVSMVDHSGIAYRAGHPSQFVGAYPWDAGYVGLIYATEDAIKKNYMVDKVNDELRKQVIKALEEEVAYYSAWVEGYCYGFRIYGINGDEIDSCWGFIGDDAETNGIEDYTGKLHDCSFTSVDEYVDSCEESGITVRVVKTGRVVKTTSKQEIFV